MPMIPGPMTCNASASSWPVNRNLHPKLCRKSKWQTLRPPSSSTLSVTSSKICLPPDFGGVSYYEPVFVSAETSVAGSATSGKLRKPSFSPTNVKRLIRVSKNRTAVDLANAGLTNSFAAVQACKVGSIGSSHSPIIFTSTRFLRRPSNSP